MLYLYTFLSAEIVDSLLEDLGLMVCADVMIGGPLIKGISGGQKKRTSVGVELITNPSVCLLLCNILLYRWSYRYSLMSSCYFSMSRRQDWIPIQRTV